MLSLECNVPTTSSVLPISREVVRSSLEAQRGRGLPSLASASPPHECEDDIFLVDLGKRSLSVPVLPVLSRCTGRGSCSVCVLWHLGQGSLLPCPACSYSFCVVSSRSESEGMCPPSAFLPPTGAGLLLGVLRFRGAWDGQCAVRHLCVPALVSCHGEGLAGGMCFLG